MVGGECRGLWCDALPCFVQHEWAASRKAITSSPLTSTNAAVWCWLQVSFPCSISNVFASVHVQAKWKGKKPRLFVEAWCMACPQVLPSPNPPKPPFFPFQRYTISHPCLVAFSCLLLDARL